MNLREEILEMSFIVLYRFACFLLLLSWYLDKMLSSIYCALFLITKRNTIDIIDLVVPLYYLLIVKNRHIGRNKLTVTHGQSITTNRTSILLLKECL